MRIILCNNNSNVKSDYVKRIKKCAFKNGLSVSIISYNKIDQLIFDLNLNRSDADIIYLNVANEGKNLVEKTDQIKNHCRAEIIFTSENEQQWCQWAKAFDAEARYYIVDKACTEEKFEEIFMSTYFKSKKKERETMLFTWNGERVMIAVEDIEYFEIINRIVYVHYDGDKEFHFYSTIGKLEDLLLAKGFFRIHRAFLVNGRQIRSVSRKSVIMQSGVDLKIGKTYGSKVVQDIVDSNEHIEIEGMLRHEA